MIPLQVVRIISELGLGEQVTAAAVLAIVVLYLFRGKKAAGTVVGVVGTIWFAGVSVGVALAVALLMGWVDPNVSEFLSDVQMLAGELLRLLMGPVEDFVRSRI